MAFLGMDQLLFFLACMHMGRMHGNKGIVFVISVQAILSGKVLAAALNRVKL